MKGNFDIEHPDLDELFEKYRKSPESYVFAPLADACRKMGRIDEALEICERGLGRHPRYVSGHVVKGKCLFDMGHSDAAEGVFREVLRFDSNNLVALKYVGMIEAEAGRLTEAKEHFRHILALDPDNKEIQKKISKMEELEKSGTEALEITDVDDDGPFDGAEEEEFEGQEIDLGDDETPPEGLEGRVIELRHVEDHVEAPAGPGIDTPAADGDTELDESPIEAGGASDDEESAARAVSDEAADGTEAPGEKANLAGELATITLAEIYAAQGYTTKAIKIYQEVLKRQPDNQQVIRKLRTLTGGAFEAGMKPRRPDLGTAPDGASNDVRQPAPAEDPAARAARSSGPPSEPDRGRADEAPERAAGTTTPHSDREISERDSLDFFKRWLSNIRD